MLLLCWAQRCRASGTTNLKCVSGSTTLLLTQPCITTKPSPHWHAPHPPTFTFLQNFFLWDNYENAILVKNLVLRTRHLVLISSTTTSRKLILMAHKKADAAISCLGDVQVVLRCIVMTSSKSARRPPEVLMCRAGASCRNFWFHGGNPRTSSCWRAWKCFGPWKECC